VEGRSRGGFVDQVEAPLDAVEPVRACLATNCCEVK
jgi:hypothetical protein